MKTMVSKRCLLWLALFVLGTLPMIGSAADAEIITQEADLREEIDRLRSAYQELSSTLEGREGDERELLQLQLYNLSLKQVEAVHELVGVLLEMEAGSAQAVELRSFLEPLLTEIPAAFRESLAREQVGIDELRSTLKETAVGERVVVQKQIGRASSRVDTIYKWLVEHLDLRESLGEDVSAERQALLSELVERAYLTTGRVQRDATTRKTYLDLVASDPDNSEFKQQLAAVRAAVESGVKSLEQQVALLDGLGHEVEYFQTVLVEASGDLSRGFGWEVVRRLGAKWWDGITAWLDDGLRRLLGQLLVFAAIVAVFAYVGRVVRKTVEKMVNRPSVKLSMLLRKTISKVSGNLVLALGIVVALSQVGVSLGPLLAGLGVAGFIVGFALQETLGNFASGMMILFYKPFDVGDYIETAGVAGKVHHMSLVSTTILTFDNQTLIIPNGKVWGEVIRNVTHQDIRRVDLIIGVAYDSDIPQVDKVLQSVVDDYDKVLKDPETKIRVNEMADSSVNFKVMAWVNTDDYWEAYWHLTREIKMRLDKEGITIPFPQRDVHHYYPEGPKKEGQGESGKGGG